MPRSRYLGGQRCTDDKELLKKVRDTLVEAKPDWIAMDYGTIEKMVAGDFSAASTGTARRSASGCATRRSTTAIRRKAIAVWMDNVAVLKDAKNVENAKLFQNFIMDPENAALISAFARYANGIDGSDKFMPADMKDAPEVIVPADCRKRRILACPPEVHELYTKIWTELQK